MNWFATVAFMLLLFTASSCGNSGETASPDSDEMREAMESLSRATMGSPGLSGDNNETEIVITDQQSFNRLWNRAHQGIGNERDAAPEIDFDRNVVVAVVMGEKPSSGYSIEITGVQVQDDDSVKLNVRTVRPGPACMSLTVITYPHHIVKLPAAGKELQFDYEEVVDECS
jgi:hypothetical protein